jgi:hypothetical protein
MGGEKQVTFSDRKCVPDCLDQRLNERDAVTLREAKRTGEIGQDWAPMLRGLGGNPFKSRA